MGEAGARYDQHAVVADPAVQPVRGLVPVRGYLGEAPRRGQPSGQCRQRHDPDGHHRGHGHQCRRRRGVSESSALDRTHPREDTQEIDQAQDERQPDHDVELVHVTQWSAQPVEELSLLGGEGAGQLADMAQSDQCRSHDQGGDEETAAGQPSPGEPGDAQGGDDDGRDDQRWFIRQLPAGGPGKGRRDR